MMEVPEWVTAYVDACMRAMGVVGWQVTIQMVRRIDETDVLGRTSLDSRYLRACIQLRDTLQPDDEGYGLIAHEVFHIATYRQEIAVDRIIDLVPPKLQSHAHDLWQDGDEPTTEQFARAQAATIVIPKVI